jgi:hypothetical protein
VEIRKSNEPKLRKKKMTLKAYLDHIEEKTEKNLRILEPWLIRKGS